jgi:hypothetical protein
MNNKTCPRCGLLFSCTMSINCWCMIVDIPQKVKDHMAEHYQDCLCPDCIHELKNIINPKNVYE